MLALRTYKKKIIKGSLDNSAQIWTIGRSLPPAMAEDGHFHDDEEDNSLRVVKSIEHEVTGGEVFVIARISDDKFVLGTAKGK